MRNKDNSELLNQNPNLVLQNDLFQDTSKQFRDSSLSNYIRLAVQQVYLSVSDKSLHSIDIENSLNTDELRQELSAKPYNFLQALDYQQVRTTLDLSQDFGGVTSYLADNSDHLDSVKIDADKSRLSLLRCANKENVSHICEDLDKINFPLNHYDLIVIGKLEALELGQTETATLLQKLNLALTEKGSLVVNVQNRERISKWINSSDNIANKTPYSELYQTEYEQQHLKHDLQVTLAGAGYSNIEFHATFSQHDEFQNLFSEDYLESGANVLNHFYRSGLSNNEEINEYLLFRNFVEDQKRICELASRYLIVAGKQSAAVRSLCDRDFTHFAGTSRLPRWRANTYRFRGAPMVHKTALHFDDSSEKLAQNPDHELIVEQDLSDKKFHRGHLLVDEWLTAVHTGDIEKFRSLVNEYTARIEELSKQADFCESSYDLLPFNIIIGDRDAARAYRALDTEWKIKGNYEPTLVVFRALLWFAFENKPVLQNFASTHNIENIGMFVIEFLPTAGRVSDLDKWVAQEESIQSQISLNFKNKSVAHLLFQSFGSKLNSDGDNGYVCQLSWINNEQQIDEHGAIFVDWNKENSKPYISSVIPARTGNSTKFRIDPFARKAIFSIEEVTFSSSDESVIYQLSGAEEVNHAAEMHNINEAKQVDTSLIALNDDPHLIFDLAHLGELINDIQSIHVSISLNDDSAQALDRLAKTNLQLSTALSNQSSTLNRYHSEIDYLSVRMADISENRNDLKRSLFKLEQQRASETHRLHEQVTHLNNLLAAQTIRTEAMENFLMTRTSVRAKDFFRRNIAKLKFWQGAQHTIEPESQDLMSTDQELDTEEMVVDNNTSAKDIGDHEELIGQNTEDYQLWIKENEFSEDQILAAKKSIEAMTLKPVFSIVVPVYNVDVEYLIAMIRSVQAQIYPHWQLCIVDDASPKSYLRQILEHEAQQDERISIQLNTENQGISLATNDALRLATGDYIGLLDHDDELSINALYENAKLVNEQQNIGLIYSDEDKMDMEGNRLEPYFKPDYSPDLLDTNNYVCHFTVIKKSITDSIGGFREGLDGSQDHDIILRSIAEAQKDGLQIRHIPKILYHWRKIPGSTAVAYDSKSYAWEAGRKAVEACLDQDEPGTKVEFGTLKGTYRVFREIKGEPLVSIIIPFKDKPELLDSCLGSIINRSSYKNIEIIGISNNSEQELTHERMSHFGDYDPRIRFVEKNIPFNFSALCNFGAEQANGEYLLFLNNDIEIISPDWIERLLEHAQRPQNGAVGGKLLYPDGRIQHAGVVAGMVGAAGHPHKFFPDNHIGYHGRLHMVYNVSAVTGAMMMVAKDKFIQAGQFNEENLAVAYNDIDLCLSLLDHGYLNVFTPHCKATHHESISRGYEDTQEKLDRLKSEQEFFLNKWRNFLDQGDPYYNPNLSLKNERFSLKFND